MPRTCPAIDVRTQTKCGRPVTRRDWCTGHFIAQKSHYKTYKHDSDAFARFETTKISTDLAEIALVKNAKRLREWFAKLRKGMALCARAIDSRAFHHTQYFGGGDMGHHQFLISLRTKHGIIEQAVEAIAQRHDEISSNPPSNEHDRDTEEIEAVLRYHASDAEHFSIHRITRQDLLRRLFSFRKFHCIHQVDSDEWTRFVDFMERIIIQVMRRRAGMRMLFANSKLVRLTFESFLSSEALVTPEELKQIYVGVHLTPPRHVLRSINDAFRSTDPAKDPHIIILGRRIYDNVDAPICLDAWDVFEDFMPARKWAIHAAPNLTAWLEIDRIIALGLRFTSWQPPHLDIDAGKTPASIVFPLTRVFIQFEWPRVVGPPAISRKYKKEWIETERRAAVYLKFSESELLFFQRVVGLLQARPSVFGVLPITSGHFKFDVTGKGDGTRVIPSIPDVLSAGRWRKAVSRAKLKHAEWMDLPYFTASDIRDKFTGNGPLAMSDPGGVLHLLVVDRCDAGEVQLRDNIASVLLFMRMHDWDAPPPRTRDPYHSLDDSLPLSQLEFFRAEMRILCNPSVAPALGLGQEGLVAIAAGAIHVDGETFRRFKDRLTQILERHADENLVRRWERKKAKRQRGDAVRCWDQYKRKLERIACCREFFFLGTADGHDYLKQKLGREISPVDGAVELYDEEISHHVFQKASDRAQLAEKMMPPREEPLDWDNPVCESDTIDCNFDFLKEVKPMLDPLNAMIVEVSDVAP
ncbi:Epimerase domain-containing protein [Mycena chlorophos]|uniref:Epimerase domain-containing protein n=1 Tax=Mycena chlorophos TaxID=658473 RepID=A0A8H6SCV8_MYCCL|nr:Epimerase domain-containing protein [Mycena chlorophos]